VFRGSDPSLAIQLERRDSSPPPRSRPTILLPHRIFIESIFGLWGFGDQRIAAYELEICLGNYPWSLSNPIFLVIKIMIFLECPVNQSTCIVDRLNYYKFKTNCLYMIWAVYLRRRFLYAIISKASSLFHQTSQSMYPRVVFRLIVDVSTYGFLGNSTKGSLDLSIFGKLPLRETKLLYLSPSSGH
jgi:hypothetical protein